MALVNEASFQDVSRLIERFSIAGLSIAEMQELIDDRPLVRTMIAALRDAIEPVFTSPEEMVNKLEERATLCKWGIDDAIEHLRASIPHVPTERLHALSIEVWLGSLDRTFKELSTWITGPDPVSNPSTWKMKLEDETAFLRFTPHAEWVALDLSKVGRPTASGKPNMSGFAVMAALALHPEWRRKMRYHTVPSVTGQKRPKEV